ncbi:olfactory receptor 1052-like [Spea bombifrons]|uniref:olfactory receptor 1052-like n=1 Tax=Spea bombifrons TaxID=233779 RepID=UPI00234B6D5B|nr:olfactory receptor 1052-like [Spea bombifrons]
MESGSDWESKVAQGRKSGKLVTGSGQLRIIDACREGRLVRVLKSNRRASVAQIADKVTAGSDRKASKHTEHCSLLRMGLGSRRPVRWTGSINIDIQKSAVQKFMNNQTFDSDFHILAFSTSTGKQPLQFMLFFFIYVVSLIGNLSIILVTFLERHLHTPMYFFLRNLSFVDICYISVTLPKLMDIFLTGNNAISFTPCFTQLHFFTTMGCTEVVLLTSMAYDRYVAICNPLMYFLQMNYRRCSQLVLGSWAFGFINSLLVTVFASKLSFCGARKVQQLFCDIKSLLKISCSDTEGFQIIVYLEVLFAGLCPFIFSLTSYIKIISSILKVQSTEGRVKSFSTCTSHLTVLLIFYGTIFCMYIRPPSEHSEQLDQFFSILYVAVTPMLNPLIYSLRNQDVKKALKRVITLKSRQLRFY